MCGLIFVVVLGSCCCLFLARPQKCLLLLVVVWRQHIHGNSGSVSLLVPLSCLLFHFFFLCKHARSSLLVLERHTYLQQKYTQHSLALRRLYTQHHHHNNQPLILWCLLHRSYCCFRCLAVNHGLPWPLTETGVSRCLPVNFGDSRYCNCRLAGQHDKD